MPDAPPTPDIPPAEGERGNVPSESADLHADAFGDAFAELDKLTGVEAPAPRPAPPAPVEPSKAPAKPAAPLAKPPESAKPASQKEPPGKAGEPQRGPDGKFLPRKDEPAKPADKPPEEPQIEKLAAPELRKAYQELRKKHAALEAERAKAAAAPKPAELGEHPEVKRLSETLTEREKRLAELEDELRYSSYERTAEYKEKYEKPFIAAWQTGQNRAKGLKVLEQKDALDEVVSPARAGTEDDFNTLMQIQSDDEAAEWAHKMFGAKAPLLLYHRERVQEANIAKETAKREFQANGTQRLKQQAEFMEKQQEAVRKLYHQTRDTGVEQYPRFFKADENDPRTKELLDKGNRLADRALGAPDVEGEKPLTGEQRVKLTAAMRNCFGAFQRIVYELNKERKARAELQKSLEQYEASQPQGGDGRAGGVAPTPEAGSESPDSAFDAAFGSR